MNILTELCQELKNWFDRDQKKWIGAFQIQNQNIVYVNRNDLDLIEGQYFRIVGSRLNDGVYQFPAEDLRDETFTGAVWSMAVPPSVLELAEEISAYNEKYQDKINSPFQSESFGGYSYTKSTSNGGSSGSSNPSNWKHHFADDLNRWRKL